MTRLVKQDLPHSSDERKLGRLTGDQSMLSANCPQYNLSAESARARIGEPGSEASYLLTMR